VRRAATTARYDLIFDQMLISEKLLRDYDLVVRPRGIITKCPLVPREEPLKEVEEITQ
jgi:hypothetical protein